MARDDTADADSFGHSPEEQLQKRIFVSTFSMLAKLANADGTVTKREVDLIERVMDEVLQLDPDRKRFAIRVFNEARKSRTTFKEHCEEYRKLLANKPKMYEWMMDVLLRVALADQVYAGPEADALEVAASVFQIPPQRYAELRSKYQRSAGDEHYRTLGCTPDAPTEEIEKRYQKLRHDYDPARVLAANLPHDLVSLAEQRSAAITAAYVQIMKDRGARKS